MRTWGALLACGLQAVACTSAPPATPPVAGGGQDAGAADGTLATTPDGGTADSSSAESSTADSVSAAVCEAGASTCVAGNAVQTCSATGMWGAASACGASLTCSGGACDGVCGPGQTRCVDGSHFQECTSDGQYGTLMACGPGLTCVAGTCTGVCAPGQSQCSDASHVQTCDASGQWGAAWACATGACAGGACTGATTTGASCTSGSAGTTACGATGESCCTSLEVPGGTFSRTFTPGPPPTGQADPAVVTGYRLDKYDATVGRFRAFVAAWNAGWLPAAGSGKHAHLNGGLGLADSASPGSNEPGWLASDTASLQPTSANLTTCAPSTWTDAPGANEALPINCASWFDARAFCIWDGGFLPSEAEWEYASVGGSQQRLYPWGSTPPGTANQYAIYGGYYEDGGVAPVGAAPLGAGLWGHLDLSGGISQWSLDYWLELEDPCTDCAILSGGSEWVHRGGCYSSGISYLVPASGVGCASLGDPRIGFRCAKTP